MLTSIIETHIRDTVSELASSKGSPLAEASSDLVLSLEKVDPSVAREVVNDVERIASKLVGVLVNNLEIYIDILQGTRRTTLRSTGWMRGSLRASEMLSFGGLRPEGLEGNTGWQTSPQ
jgi:hypothetical protein